ncbi:aspartate aminotransferase family protein [Roseisolibacter sp. H3M3-2]|uniref:aspartate aminotransferase family protein n=1 Tax=Roseisolibacter sp. H3M3-2 TaxID=3031323 RepID=UPI0023D9F246|nr:aspartate aminotransferase family protein [Roseisolibacter sp. H3M3-2]MDF1503717.1 aspartate aminotransferase family protein [Roseisolibacter sp. H3M3-2]
MGNLTDDAIVADVLATGGLAMDAHWMPFTSNRAFKKAPRVLVAAEGMHYTAADGRRVLDGTAGLWCVNAGHCRAPIVRAIQEQAARLDFAPGFQMAHPLGFRLAERLTTLLPKPLDRVFFVNSGSEAVDTALKMALAYHAARGDTKRTRFVGRVRGYHGVGFGGISVGGIENNRRAFAGQLLPHVDLLPDTHDLSRNAFSRGLPAHGAERADALEAIVAERGADTIAALIVEPVAGSTGVLLPPVGYLERLRALCDRHGILLIFDEVISGFGRLGAPFAADRFGVTPDLMTIAKGITNAAVPMGAVCASRAVHDAVVEDAPPGIEFFHGYTYSAHPLACAAGLATLDLYDAEGLLTRAAALEARWADAVHALRGLPHVVDVRALGLVAGIELAPRDGAPGARAFDVFVDCFRRGALVRVTGDIIALSPPLIIDEGQIDELVNILGDAIRAVA